MSPSIDDVIGTADQARRLAGRMVPFQVRRALGRLSAGDSLQAAVEGRTVLVTGASSGIGRATAKLLGKSGARVILVARREHELEELRGEIEALGGEAFVHPCDLRDPEAIDRMAREVLAEHGRIHILVNNAGHSIRRSVGNSYERFHDFERTIQLNYLGAVKLILALLPQMRERGGGQIVNVSTEGVLLLTPRFSAYLASKAALDAFSRSIATEVLSDGVTVSTVHMPLVRTPMSAPTKMYERMPSLSPEEAARMIGDAIVYRPNRIATAFGNIAEFARAVNPAGVEAALNAGYRMTGYRPDRTEPERNGSNGSEQS